MVCTVTQLDEERENCPFVPPWVHSEHFAIWYCFFGCSGYFRYQIELHVVRCVEVTKCLKFQITTVGAKVSKMFLQDKA